MAPKPIRRHIFITGLPGVGKTTLIRKLAEEFKDFRPTGFYTDEIRESGVRVGFSAVSLDGQRQLLSHVRIPGPYRVGRYRVDVAGFEGFLDQIELLESRSALIVIDEIGKMECLSLKFVKLVTALLDSPKQVVATIALKGSGFIQQVKERPDVLIVEVHSANRNRLVAALTTRIRQQI